MTLQECSKRIVHERTRDLGTSDFQLFNHMVLGLCEEAGEVAGLLKRKHRGDTVAQVTWIEELGDVLWYLTNVADILGSSLEEIYEFNRLKLEGRYPKK